MSALSDTDGSSSTELRGQRIDNVSPVVLHASADPPLANTGPSSATSTTLDLSMFPTALQAQLAQFTVDLQDSKSARTSLACNHCRSRKIKCSGDRPVCSACTKSGAGETCQYPQGHAKRRKRSAIAMESARTVDEEDTSSTRTTQRHHSESGDGTSLSAEQTASSSSNRFQTLRSAATLPPTKKARTEDVETQQLQIEISGPAPDFVRSRGASELDTGLQLQQQQQQQHERVQGCDYDWSLFGEMHDTTTPSTHQAGPSEYSKTDHMERGRYSRSVQESATAGTDRDSGGSTRLRVPYFRYFGATAIAPGYKRVTADVSAPSSPSRRSRSSLRMTTASSIAIMSEDGERPHPTAIDHLCPIFRSGFLYFFPLCQSLDENSGLDRQPSYIQNIACALAARFTPTYSPSTTADRGPFASAADVWSSTAKEQVNRQLAVANLDLVEALLMISWYEFSADRDGGLWMYSGMAFRMAQDLGLDRQWDAGQDSIRDGSGPVDRSLRLHLALCMMDAIMTIGTGRNGMYQHRISPVYTFPTLSIANGQMLPDPFPYLANILAVAGTTTQIMLAQESPAYQSEQLNALQLALNGFDAALPDELRFQTATFRSYVPLLQGGAFVLIHLWFHALIILVHDPTTLLLERHTPGPDLVDLDGREISISSAKSILDIVSFAELIDPKSISQPWINYPLYIASRVFLAQTLRQQQNGQNPAPSRARVASTASANYQRIVVILANLETTWSGVRYIRQVVSQRADGIELADLSASATETSRLANSNPAKGHHATPDGWLSQDLLGFGLTGTMNSPSDHRYTFVYPPGVGNQPESISPTQPAIVDQSLVPFDIAWAEAFLADLETPCRDAPMT
ncbi:hypothetical protein HD553DRAFT_342712 [Filobasidium floriforme]|uniref:uncharacterized protein n=1 Tax=Filobasidium floriforme TaxID=5210 RepID=UPI001E8D3135|nr:uncharacterized protein HD553DRAFT_342712 [Filobasidium floriforme]KAH8083490.1 hypothetical protein HD553DRAFT_342712 [Filobasidium floriforme]